MKKSSITLFAAALCLAQPVHAAITIVSSWALGEAGSMSGTNALDGTGASNFNNSAGVTVNTATPSGALGSTAYISTTGSNGVGEWMSGSGVTLPSDNWGFQFMVRNTTTISTPGQWAGLVGFGSASTNELVIEEKNVGGTVHYEVNKSGVANLIISATPNNAVTLNQWTNLALVKNGGLLFFYVNNTLINPVGVADNTVNDGLLYLGRGPAATPASVAADYDSARLFTFAPGAFNAGTDLYVAAVPEPSTYGLMGAGALAAGAFVRRRRKPAGR